MAVHRALQRKQPGNPGIKRNVLSATCRPYGIVEVLNPCLSTSLYTASEMLVNEKSFTTIGGAIIPCPSPPRTRTGAPIATVFLSISTGLWLNRNFTTGAVTLPCSIRKTASRVRPVTCMVCGLTTLIYQNRVTNSPRSTEAIRSERLLPPPSSTNRLGNGVGCLPALAAQ